MILGTLRIDKVHCFDDFIDGKQEICLKILFSSSKTRKIMNKSAAGSLQRTQKRWKNVHGSTRRARNR